MPLSDEKQDILHALKQEPCEVIAGVRPEDIEVTQDGPQSLHAEIDVSELMGSEVYIHVNLPAEQGENPSAVSEPVKAVLRVKSYTVPESARQISMLPSASKIHLFDADTKCNLLYPETGRKASLACNAI
jgi:multiple sugar transport system ATP-binding protein